MNRSLQTFGIVYFFSLYFSGNSAVGLEPQPLLLVLTISIASILAVCSLFIKRGIPMQWPEVVSLSLYCSGLVVLLKIMAATMILLKKGGNTEVVPIKLAILSTVAQALLIGLWVSFGALLSQRYYFHIRVWILRSCMKLCAPSLRINKKEFWELRAKIYPKPAYSPGEKRRNGIDIVIDGGRIDVLEFSTDMREAPCIKQSFSTLQAFLKHVVEKLIQRSVRPGVVRMVQALKEGGVLSPLEYAEGIEGDRDIENRYLNEADKIIRRDIRIRIGARFFGQPVDQQYIAGDAQTPADRT